MIITTAQRKNAQIFIPNIKQKDCMRYLGIYIDKHLNWKYYLSHIKSKLAKNTGILYRLRRYVSLKMLVSFYYSLIYPYLNYGIISWGSAYKTVLDKILSQQRKCIRCIFFLNRSNDPSPYFKLLGIITIENINKLRVALLTYQILNKSINSFNIFDDSIVLASDIHNYNTRFSRKNNLYG